jgi:transcription elongation factor Elf1
VSGNEEDLIVWQDVLDLIQAGRTDVNCPFCQRAQVEVTQKGRVTRIMCPVCRKFIEGQMNE